MMKNIISKSLLLSALPIAVSGCVQEDDTTIPPVIPAFFAENFNVITQDDDGDVFDLPGWINYAEAGTKLWTKEWYQKDGYAQFNSFGSGQASNVAWLISPKIEFGGRTDVYCSFATA